MRQKPVERFYITYPADAARISCRLAFVNNDKTAEKIKVDTKSTPMQSRLDLSVLKVTEMW